jgi:hypothetical protein
MEHPVHSPALASLVVLIDELASVRKHVKNRSFLAPLPFQYGDRHQATILYTIILRLAAENAFRRQFSTARSSKRKRIGMQARSGMTRNTGCISMEGLQSYVVFPVSFAPITLCMAPIEQISSRIVSESSHYGHEVVIVEHSHLSDFRYPQLVVHLNGDNNLGSCLLYLREQPGLHDRQ